jgi:hypothetical protein
VSIGPPPWVSTTASQEVSGGRLVEALLASGWQIVGGRKDVYARLSFVEGSGTSHHLVVPLDASAPEYEQMRAAVLWKLRRMVDDGKDARKALTLLGLEPS